MKKKLLLFCSILMLINLYSQTGSNDRQYNFIWLNIVTPSNPAYNGISTLLDRYNNYFPVGDLVTQLNSPENEVFDFLGSLVLKGIKVDIVETGFSTIFSIHRVGRLHDITSYFNKNYFSNDIKGLKINNSHFAVPWIVNPRTLIANTKILKEAGVNFEIETVEDFEKALELVKVNHLNNKDSKSDNDILPYALVVNDIQRGSEDFMAWLWAFGGEIFDSAGRSKVGSKEMITTLTWYKSLVDKKYIDYISKKDSLYKLFKEGKVAFIEASYNDALLLGINSTSMKNIKVMKRPVLKKKGTSPAFVEGSALSVIQGTLKTNEVINFMRFLTQTETSVINFKENKWLPANKEAFEDPYLKRDEWAYAWKPILENTRITDITGLNERFNASVILSELFLILSDKKTPSVAATAMQNRLRK
ncbi:MAG: extracellular solute-binding protein [Treponemataceae bacterium]